ncbi:SagB family peptide dehydrogenase [Streptomyces sp. LHD-70]|uniref:SagB family peptide dehydrogenase n=1 Tax=Streptomyces sp. LHD-70 TaxID=3072140 RepID=UPI00280DC2CB|nr:SagB family peptide dehydrogenase [Streptomyces sp. LHD-70]MDQ8705967.1 SagB family peptide dehydrogenase [Streptomyces sp. LHD-70]
MNALPAPPYPSPDHVDLWSLREDTLVEFPEHDGGTAQLTTRWGDLTLPGTGPLLRSALERMSYGPVSLHNIAGGADYRELTACLGDLEHIVIRSLSGPDGRPLLSAVPISRRARFRTSVPGPGTLHRLSRFALIRTAAGGLWVESPLSGHRVELHRAEATWLLGCFGRATTAEAVADRLGLPTGLVRAAVAYLTAVRMLVSAVGGGGRPGFAEFPEDRDPALASWSPFDLMLHSRSRLGRHDDPFGAAERGAPDAAAATRAPYGAPAPIPLPRPALARLLSQDPPITAVLEARRSVRTYGSEPLSLARLGELLYRAARIRTPESGSLENGSPDAPAVSTGSRPYPSLGGSYPLELYITAGNCAGLARGTYHYDPLALALRPLAAPAAAVDELLAQARISASLTTEPPVLITMTARFGAMNRRYDGLAYSGLLKEVGALQQTLYLVSTAMGLAPCALAIGDSDLLAHAFGLDWLKESSVGEFVLGPLPAEELAGESGNTPVYSRF